MFFVFLVGEEWNVGIIYAKYYIFHPRLVLECSKDEIWVERVTGCSFMTNPHLILLFCPLFDLALE